MITILLTVLALFIPGLVVAYAAGVRGWLLAGVAGPVTYGVVAVVGPLTASLGVHWSAYSAAGAIVLTALVLAAVRWLWQRRGPQAGAQNDTEARAWSRRANIGVALAVAGGGVAGAAVVARGLSSLAAIPQDWDAVFHGEAIEFILRTGNASPFALAALSNSPLPTFYYPNTYHTLEALVLELHHAGIPEAINSQAMLLGLLLALGVAALVQQLGGRALIAASSGLLSGCFTAFPADVLWRGPLLPLASGIAVLPGALALFLFLLQRRTAHGALLLAFVAAGLLGLQPSTAITFVLFALPALLMRWISQPRQVARDTAVLIGTAATAAVVGVVHLRGLLTVSSEGAYDWPVTSTPARALGELFGLQHDSPFPQWWLFLLLAVGLLNVLRARFVHPILPGLLIQVVLFVMTTSYNSPLTEALTLPWWNDQYRFAAIIVPFFAIIAGIGVSAIVDFVVDKLPAIRSRTAKPVVAALVLLAFGALSNGFYVRANAGRVALGYTNGPTVSAAEADGLRKIGELDTTGGKVLNDPRDGSGWMYALSGVMPLFPQPYGPTAWWSPDRLLLENHFNQIDRDPAVRTAVDKLDVQYVSVGKGFIRKYDERAPGLTGLDSVRSLDKVWSNSEIAIYRILPAGEVVNLG